MSKEERKLYMKEYYEKNRESILKQKKEYYENNIKKKKKKNKKTLEEKKEISLKKRKRRLKKYTNKKKKEYIKRILTDFHPYLYLPKEFEKRVAYCGSGLIIRAFDKYNRSKEMRMAIDLDLIKVIIPYKLVSYKDSLKYEQYYIDKLWNNNLFNKRRIVTNRKLNNNNIYCTYFWLWNRDWNMDRFNKEVLLKDEEILQTKNK